MYTYKRSSEKFDFALARIRASTEKLNQVPLKGLADDRNVHPLPRCMEWFTLRPVHLLRVFLLRVLESNFPGDPLSNSTDMRIPTL